ncbi:4-hydroxythreonine-4-phosphate dehydrogenase PdxA [Arundinibacter roseus]|uniref:4-hydroxythreonine-4-phosphate dehydrogenase PdxA n=1 Tax=Arundinibacter roseus TaxID=2070510 RepID=A0A4R4K5Y5_9BACT|nr:4-hydroxythreonine-4-phosphate dehydrogenase PdxA [Arundinibacter roseus]TDB62723.1 4-hydroxythreonine-4-phosphate dehydrogenase PdxA [Arundinibacter roseus]
MKNPRPLLGISAGDPAGIGPEVTVKALALPEIYEICRPLIVCDAFIIEQMTAILSVDLKINRVKHPQEGIYRHGTLDVLEMNFIQPASFAFNVVSAMCGAASFAYVKKVIELASANLIDGTVTGPIHKEALHLAGYPYAGHTEIYGSLTNTRDYTMMLAEKDFRVVHVSTHVSLREAIERTKKERILSVISLADHALKTMGIDKPRIAVAGLNPHAGENGLFGDEEILEIIPAIDAARQMGILADGPHPPDTIFPKLKGGLYDCVVCMYHDQGHIPTKLLGFTYNALLDKWENLSGVNITLGLPIIRVSVDHGVAFDKGGKGEAQPESMIEAIQQCARFALNNSNAHAAETKD